MSLKSIYQSEATFPPLFQWPRSTTEPEGDFSVPSSTTRVDTYALSHTEEYVHEAVQRLFECSQVQSVAARWALPYLTSRVPPQPLSVVSLVRVGALISVSFLEHSRPAYLLSLPTFASPFAGALVPCTSCLASSAPQTHAVLG